MADRRLMAEGKLPLDWGMAENLAYATLLSEGFSVRISLRRKTTTTLASTVPCYISPPRPSQQPASLQSASTPVFRLYS